MISAGRLGGALRHAQQRSHTELPHPILIQHFAFQAVGRHRARAVRHDRRRQSVGGLVRQIAREVLCVGDDASTLEGMFDLGGSAASQTT